MFHQANNKSVIDKRNKSHTREISNIPHRKHIYVDIFQLTNLSKVN